MCILYSNTDSNKKKHSEREIIALSPSRNSCQVSTTTRQLTPSVSDVGSSLNGEPPSGS